MIPGTNAKVFEPMVKTAAACAPLTGGGVGVGVGVGIGVAVGVAVGAGVAVALAVDVGLAVETGPGVATMPATGPPELPLLQATSVAATPTDAAATERKMSFLGRTIKQPQKKKSRDRT
jgi:hypothetical protein